MHTKSTYVFGYEEITEYNPRSCIVLQFTIKGVGGGEAAANNFAFKRIHDFSLYTFSF